MDIESSSDNTSNDDTSDSTSDDTSDASDDTSDGTSDDAAQCSAKRKHEGDNYIYSGGKLTKEEKQTVVDVKIVDYIMDIPKRAFYCCKHLMTIDISSSSILSKIQASAFGECVSLIRITFPTSLEIIEKRAFRNCNNLSTILFPNKSKCKEIQKQAFSGCNSLTSINLPDSIEIVGENVRFILSFFFVVVLL